MQQTKTGFCLTFLYAKYLIWEKKMIKIIALKETRSKPNQSASLALRLAQPVLY